MKSLRRFSGNTAGEAFLWASLFFASGTFAQHPPETLRGETKRIILEVHERGGYPDYLPLVENKGSSRNDTNTGDTGRPEYRERNPIRRARRRNVTNPTSAPPTGSPGFIIPEEAAKYFVLALTLTAGIFFIAMLVSYALEKMHGKKKKAGKEAQASGEVSEFPSRTTLQELGPSEAIRKLLLKSLEMCGWKAEGRTRGFTAREVAMAMRPGDERKKILLDIIKTVELVSFGGKRPTAEMFEKVLDSYGKLEAAARGQGT